MLFMLASVLQASCMCGKGIHSSKGCGEKKLSHNRGLNLGLMLYCGVSATKLKLLATSICLPSPYVLTVSGAHWAYHRTVQTLRSRVQVVAALQLVHRQLVHEVRGAEWSVPGLIAQWLKLRNRVSVGPGFEPQLQLILFLLPHLSSYELKPFASIVYWWN